MRYNGWRSTKLHLSLIAMALVTAVYALLRFPPDQFGNYCTALVAFAGLYGGASAVEKFSTPRKVDSPD